MVKGSNPNMKLLNSLVEPQPLPLYPPESSSSQQQQQQHHVPKSALQRHAVSAAVAAASTKHAVRLEKPDAASSRICYNSINYFADNPDAIHRRYLGCTCGDPVQLDEDWHTEICDGTVVCGGCSSCSRCGLTGNAANRRLVSIDGYVLCYLCIQHYGEPRVKAWRPKVVEHQGKRNARRLRRRNTNAANEEAGAATAGHNIADVDELMTNNLEPAHHRSQSQNDSSDHPGAVNSGTLTDSTEKAAEDPAASSEAGGLMPHQQNSEDSKS